MDTVILFVCAFTLGAGLVLGWLAVKVPAVLPYLATVFKRAPK